MEQISLILQGLLQQQQRLCRANKAGRQLIALNRGNEPLHEGGTSSSQFEQREWSRHTNAPDNQILYNDTDLSTSNTPQASSITVIAYVSRKGE